MPLAVVASTSARVGWATGAGVGAGAGLAATGAAGSSEPPQPDSNMATAAMAAQPAFACIMIVLSLSICWSMPHGAGDVRILGCCIANVFCRFVVLCHQMSPRMQGRGGGARFVAHWAIGRQPKGTPMETTAFGLIIVGDEILSGKRADKHLPKVIELLGERGLRLSWAEVVGDEPARITALLERTFAGGDIVFSCGGIGATPDDHTRQCAARALGVPLALHPEGRLLVEERIRDTAREAGQDADLNSPDNLHRLKMAEFPAGASIIPNPYNKIPGFTVARHHFVPGFPVMAWPMIAWVLDTLYADRFHREAHVERAVLVYGQAESVLTPLMERLESRYPGVRVFSLPSVGDAHTRRHIELGVKGDPVLVESAYADMRAGLTEIGAEVAPLHAVDGRAN
jgi:molybdopterin-biosynthesis enzyme MoeA-like protein